MSLAVKHHGGDFLQPSASVSIVTLNPLSSLLERGPGLGSGDLDLCFFCNAGSGPVTWVKSFAPLHLSFASFEKEAITFQCERTG